MVILLAFLGLALAMLQACQSDDELNFKRYYSQGSTVYQNHCQNCHGANGEGLGTLIPPLCDSTYLKNNLHYLACMVNKGFESRRTVKGKVYMGKMAGNNLTPIEVAEVLTYVNNSFGNKLGLLDVEQVNKDLMQCK